MDEEFFAAYDNDTKKIDAIPGLQMNKPLTTNTLAGEIGLELEMEALNNLPGDGYLEHLRAPTTRAEWMGVRDGSLRGSSLEYIFSTPVTREELPQMLNGLFATIEQHKTKLANSNRCSTHVHINMKGRLINQITSIIALWCVFEEHLIEWCGETRKKNHHALSMQDSNSVIDSWNSFLKQGRFEGMGQDRHGLKYSALNILPLFTRGSLEFRCGKASDEPTYPTMWAIFLACLCEYAAEVYKNPSQLAFDLSELGGVAIFNNICSRSKDILTEGFKDAIINEQSVNEFNDKCLKGFRTCQSLVLGYPWDKWLTLISKEFVPNPFAQEKPRRGLVINRIQPMVAPDRIRFNDAGRLADAVWNFNDAPQPPR